MNSMEGGRGKAGRNRLGISGFYILFRHWGRPDGNSMSHPRGETVP